MDSRKELKGAPFTRGDFRAAANDNFEALFAEIEVLRSQMSQTFGASHSVASHNDTRATGIELDLLTHGGMIGQNLHSHSGLRFQTGDYGAVCSLMSGDFEIPERDLSVKKDLKVLGVSRLWGEAFLNAIVNLPAVVSQTSDPHVSGRLWNEHGFLRISEG